MKKLLIILLIIVAALPARAKVTAERGRVPDSYNFWLSTPDDKAEDENKPLVIFLHGASLCGTNLDRVRRYGTIDAIEKGRKIDAYVIAPQNPGGAWKPAKIMKLVEWMESNYDVDSQRIYVLGMSLGGYGTIDFAAAYPDRVAAALAMCGGGTSNELCNLNEVPLWIVHGTADRAVTIAQSDKVVSEMKNANDSTPRLIYDRVPGMNHSLPARMFYLPETYDWLFSHSLADEDRQVNPAFPVTNEKLRTAYRDLRNTGTSSSKKRSSKKRSKSRRKK